MKAEAFTGAAQRVNTDHYATENKAFITVAVYLLMYCKLGLKTAKVCFVEHNKKKRKAQNKLLSSLKLAENSLNENASLGV